MPFQKFQKKQNNLTSWSVDSKLKINYEISLTKEIFNELNYELISHGSNHPNSRRLIFIDDGVYEFIINDVNNYFSHHKIDTKIIVIDIAEEKKDLETLLFMLEEIENFAVERRREPIIAIGGGVLLDMVGFAASMYRRGVPYIKVPTTLLAIVDASVGVKTSINHFGRRNRLGSYTAPLAAYLDPKLMVTLESSELISAYGEIIKMAVIKDHALFDLMEKNIEKLTNKEFLMNSDGNQIIERSISGMVEELCDNLYELDLERLVDFGHSFGPLIEMRSLDDKEVKSLSHGEAVNLDVLFSSCISYKRGFLKVSDLKRIFTIANAIGLSIEHPYFYEVDFLWEALEDTTRHRNGDQNLPIPSSIGKGCFLNDVTYEELNEIIKVFRSMVDEIKKQYHNYGNK